MALLNGYSRLRGVLQVHNVVRQIRHNSSSIRSLQAAFRDPSSPFHLPPGAQGPASPDDLSLNDGQPLHTGLTHSASEVPSGSDSVSPAKEARELLLGKGYDPDSFFEQTIVWGDHDSFQHVNNVRYARFFESGRMKWITAVGDDLGGPERATAMLKGKGVSFILKSLSIDFKRPVTYPDTLLIAHKPHFPDHPPTSPFFNVQAVAYSYGQRAIVTLSDSVIVWYDYDKLRKTNPGEREVEALRRRAGLGPA
ncbi:hypothetical protein PLICRDRAFT_44529 [Plicaturopsis crispa FD-325 SS-3]|nr:hypothetical protein PLICRDRAFT_44529 [Plicaturopsis crispa FD-325 SS-3]